MKFIASTSFLLAFTFAGFGQEQIPDTFFQNLKGKPKSAILERIYVIIKGRNVGSVVERLGSAHYDHDGKVVQSSLYGNGEERRIYSRSGANLRIEVLYFDKFGNPATDKTEPFTAKVDNHLEAGLCLQFTVQTNIDLVGKVERDIENCPDGSVRATTLFEFGQKDELRREIRTDALSRSWESILNYDSANNPTEFRFIVTSEKGKSYTHTINYVEHRFDSHGNMSRVTATAFNSNYPGRLIYQYVDQSTITYYEN